MVTIHIDPIETHPREGDRVVEQTQRNRKGLTNIIWGIILILALSILGGIILIKATLLFKPSPQSAYVRTEMNRVISNPIRQACSTEETCIGANPSGCSIFTVSKGGQVFFGGNDDYYNPDSYYWVDPGGVQGYGAIWIGKPDNVQQGVNEKGLAYDANGLPRVDVNPYLERRPDSGDYSSYPIQILHECSTVEEVITWVNTHQWHSYMHDQMHFADATGDAVIISAGADGEVVFTRKPPGDSFLVSTNFNVANSDNRDGFNPCWHYENATDQLDQLLSQEGELTVQDAANVLDAIHVEGNGSS